MRVFLGACVLLLVTACGAQGAASVVPTASAIASPAQQAPATSLAQATPAPTVTVGPAGPTTGATVASGATAAPASPATAQAATAAPGLTEYTAANGDRVLGKPGAPITMLDYSDFQ